MAELNTLARPYANAVFDLAKAAGDLPGWSETLAMLAGVVEHDDTKALVGNPMVSGTELAGLVSAICGDRLRTEGRNLVKLLVDKKRLELMPAIASLYEALRAEAEQRVEVEVHSAVELTEERKQALSQALKKRLDRDVALDCKIDSELIGGVLIRAGDLIIDHSVRAQLHQMKSFINR